MAISLRQLEYFVTVVDEGSFTRAAQILHVTHPGLSHQIQALERDLGGPLLERLPRKVRLTPAGRTALPHATASLAHAEPTPTAARRGGHRVWRPASCTSARCSRSAWVSCPAHWRSGVAGIRNSRRTWWS